MKQVLVALMTLAIAPSVNGAIVHGPVEWAIADDGNGHFYQLVDYQAGISWTAARDDAASMTLNGSAGHLVTVTSAEEDAFLKANFESFIGDPNTGVPGIFAWIGLSDAANEGSFAWVTGEPFSYSIWAPPEPNDLGGEDYVHLWRRNFGEGPLWSWNDTNNNPNNPDSPAWTSALVEFDGPFTAVPEPTTAFTWALGGLALAIATRRRKKE